MPPSWLPQVALVGRSLGRGLLHLLLPGCCQFCSQPLADHLNHFCDPCKSKILDDPEEVCPRCAGRVGPFAVRDGRCRNCQNETYAFERVLRLGPYDGLLREAVLRLKHAYNEGLAELLGELWVEHARTAFEGAAVNLVVPVPLHWRRHWQRGYNQSAAIARGIATSLGVILEARGLRRARHTPSQTTQTPSTRRDNVRGAFRAGWGGSHLAGKSILLIDDVMTTGATAHEASRALRQAGATRVVVAVLARAS